MNARPKRGFAAMDAHIHITIAARGGKSAHERGTAYEWTKKQAREAGRKGGLVRAARRREAREALEVLTRDALND